MHAWLCENPIGVEALQWKELPTPVPKAGEVLIAIKAASLNFPDLLTVQNKYQFKPPLPFVPGSEYAGVVEAVGEGVTISRSATRSPPSARAAASAPMPASPRPA
jgi:NADPH2:quinone reductase